MQVQSNQNNFFDKASESISKHSPSGMSDFKKKLLEELILIINTAPFLTDIEKKQMLKIIHLFNVQMIVSFKESIIRQGIRYFNSQNEQ